MADGSPRVRPPERADALLRRCLPDGPKGLTILGDMHEEFEDVREGRGPRAARRWYWRTALTVSTRYVAARVLGAVGSWRAVGPELAASLTSDLRIGARMLWRTRGLSALAVLCMAVGIGAATQAFSMVTGTVLKLPPIRGADRLVVVGDSDGPGRLRPLSYQEYLDLEPIGLPLEERAAYQERSVSLAGTGRRPARMRGALMTPTAFGVVGVEPRMGRVFEPGTELTDGRRQMVVSHAVWRDVFASDPAVIGRTVRIDGETVEIIGVMPEGFGFPRTADVWLPMDVLRATDDPETEFVSMFGRIPEGLDLVAAQRLLVSASRRLVEIQPDRYESIHLTAMSFARFSLGAEWVPPSLALFVASLGVLLVACANAANLLLARSSSRTGELAVRMTLGASRARVVRQLLVETFALAALGAGFGLALAAVGLEFVTRALAQIEPPYWVGPAIDGQAMAFAVLAMIVTSLLAGTYPALRATRRDLDEVLRDGGRGSSLRMGRVTRGLVVSQLAISCGLLIVAGLTIRSVASQRTLPLGFDDEGVVTARVVPSTVGRRAAVYRELQGRVVGVPGVRTAAMSYALPAMAGFRWAVSVEGAVYERQEDHPEVNGIVVSDGFFETLGIPVELGRDIAPQEVWGPGEAVAVVSRSFVERVLGDRPPLWSSFKIGPEDSPFRYARIVGVVPDTHAASNLATLGGSRRNPSQVFVTPRSLSADVSAGPTPWSEMSLLIRTDRPLSRLMDEVRDLASEIDPDAAVFQEAALTDIVDRTTWGEDLLASTFTTVGLLALFLAAAGLHGVVAFSVRQSKQEIGIRIALGADAARIRRFVLGRAGSQLAGGLALGLMVGYALARPVASASVGVDAGDPTVYGVIVLTMLVTGFVATVFPVRAATVADPVEAMRE